MCVAAKAATFGTTQIAGARVTSRRTHLLIYGNEPTNQAGGPNAIILHIPIARNTLLSQHNVLPTRGLSALLDDMWTAAPRWVSLSFTRGIAVKNVTVFRSGMYTWVAANGADPSEVIDILQQVPTDVRVDISEALLAWYRSTWPEDALLIGCFNRASGQKAEPVAIEYAPQDWDILRMPAVDAHGEIPQFGRRVTVRHRLIVGTDEFGLGGRVTYTERHQFDPSLAAVLPQLVVGAELLGFPMPNGDFYVDFSRFQTDDGNAQILRAHGPTLTTTADEIPALTA